MIDKNVRLTYKIYKKYPRYTIYYIFRNVYDDNGNRINRQMIYKTTSPPKECDKDE